MPPPPLLEGGSAQRPGSGLKNADPRARQEGGGKTPRIPSRGGHLFASVWAARERKPIALQYIQRGVVVVVVMVVGGTHRLRKKSTRGTGLGVRCSWTCRMILRCVNGVRVESA